MPERAPCRANSMRVSHKGYRETKVWFGSTPGRLITYEPETVCGGMTKNSSNSKIVV